MATNDSKFIESKVLLKCTHAQETTVVANACVCMFVCVCVRMYVHIYVHSVLCDECSNISHMDTTYFIHLIFFLNKSTT